MLWEGSMQGCWSNSRAGEGGGKFGEGHLYYDVIMMSEFKLKG